MNEDQEIKIGLTCSDDANSSETPNASKWKNGDECEYYYCEGQEWRSGIYAIQDNGFHVIRDLEDNGYTGVTKKHLRKPETEAERNERERERLEAAEELYNTYMSEWEFKQKWNALDSKKKQAFLALVDKTGYRLTK